MFFFVAKITNRIRRRETGRSCLLWSFVGEEEKQSWSVWSIRNINLSLISHQKLRVFITAASLHILQINPLLFLSFSLFGDSETSGWHFNVCAESGDVLHFDASLKSLRIWISWRRTLTWKTLFWLLFAVQVEWTIVSSPLFSRSVLGRFPASQIYILQESLWNFCLSSEDLLAAVIPKVQTEETRSNTVCFSSRNQIKAAEICGNVRLRRAKVRGNFTQGEFWSFVTANGKKETDLFPSSFKVQH